MTRAANIYRAANLSRFIMLSAGPYSRSQMQVSSRTYIATSDGLCVDFPQEIIELFGKQLTAWQIEGVGDSEFGSRPHVKENCLIAPAVNDIEHVSDAGTIILRGLARVANYGMIEAVKYLAKLNGAKLLVRESAESIAKVIWPSPSSMTGELQAFLAGFRCGIIEFSEPSVVISETLKAFPGSHVIVLANSLKKLERCKRQVDILLQSGPQHCTRICSSNNPIVFADGDDSEMEGITFSTFGYCGEVDFATSDFVFFLDAAECSHVAAQDPLAQVDAKFRLFGFTQAGRNYSRYQAAKMAQVFGFERISLRRFGFVRRFCQLYWTTENDPARILGKGSVSDLLWSGVWKNQTRNDTVAAISQTAAVSEAFPGLRDAKTAIIVENVVHAAELSRRLPKWWVFVGDDESLNMTPGSFRTRLRTQSQSWATHSRFIMTRAAAENYQSAHDLDAVIWAGAGVFTSAIPEAWLFCHSSKHKPLLIIDFEDSGSKKLRYWTNRRKADYGNRDIFPLHICKRTARIERWIRHLSDWHLELQKNGHIRP